MTEVDLQSAAQEHLWLRFTRMDGYRDAEVPMIVCSDGCYLEPLACGRRNASFPGRLGVARMARFSVRSGSFERSLDEVIPLNEAV